MLPSSSVPQLLLETRLQQAVDISPAFDNCFFHCYATYLLQNSLPFPTNLFTFNSILGNDSKAKRLQTLLTNEASLDSLFQAYPHRSCTQHFIVEKTLIFGILLREWFATELAKNHLNRDSQCTDIVTRFTSYKSYRESGVDKEQIASESSIYLSNEAFLEYFVARPKHPLSAREKHFESYFMESEEEAIKSYWTKEGYQRHCCYIADLHIKLSPNDVIPVLNTIGQPLTIYNLDGSILDSVHGSDLVPPLELKLAPEAGHYHLLKTQAIDHQMLDEYIQQYKEYLTDRENVLQAPWDNKWAIANDKSSLFVAAICPINDRNHDVRHVPWSPYSALINKLEQMQEWVKTKDHFNDQLQTIAKKRDSFLIDRQKKNDKYDKAYQAAKRLHRRLTLAGNSYFSAPPTRASYQQFKTKCDAIIEKTRPVLFSHRGWKNILGNLGHAILLLIFGCVIGYPIALLINRNKTGHALFYFPTDSSTKIQAIKNTINHAAQPSPAPVSP